MQSAINSPEEAFGAVATDGVRFASVYLPNQPQGTLVFDLAAPATAFGFNITDVGETAGAISLRTDTGAFVGGINLATFPPSFDNGNVQFYRPTQNLAFSRVEKVLQGIRTSSVSIERVVDKEIEQAGRKFRQIAYFLSRTGADTGWSFAATTSDSEDLSLQATISTGPSTTP